MTALLLLIIGAGVGVLVDQVAVRGLRRRRARRPLRLRRASFAFLGGRTSCIVVVENTSDSAVTLTAGMELRPPVGGASTGYELRGAAAAKLKSADGVELGSDDEKTFTWTVVRDGADGEFDLIGWSIVVHAGARPETAKLTRGN